MAPRCGAKRESSTVRAHAQPASSTLYRQATRQTGVPDLLAMRRKSWGHGRSNTGRPLFSPAQSALHRGLLPARLDLTRR
ncbi:MAG: hypothetical protein ACI835_001284 [Planctomycetota bacterium]|jgi:hypothetical protein